MTTHNTQEQDLRTALHKAVSKALHNNQFADGWPEMVDPVVDAVLALAAPPRPVDAERVEAAFREGWQVNAIPAKGTPEAEMRDFAHDPEYLKACEDVDWTNSNARVALLSTAHSPDKAVTREGVADARAAFEKHYSQAFDLERATWSDGYASDGVDAIWKGWRECWRALATEPTGTEAGRRVDAEAELAASVAETVKETGGWWKSCSGCHETNEGHETGRHSYSGIFRCHVGSGCRECGGLGVRWEHYSEADFAAMAVDLATPTPPVSPSPDEDAPTCYICDQTIGEEPAHIHPIEGHIHERCCTGEEEVSPSPDSTGPAGAAPKWKDRQKLAQVIRKAYRDTSARGDAALHAADRILAALTPSAPIADPLARQHEAGGRSDRGPVRDDGYSKDFQLMLVRIIQRHRNGRDLTDTLKGAEDLLKRKGSLSVFRSDATPASDVPGEVQTQEGGR